MSHCSSSWGSIYRVVIYLWFLPYTESWPKTPDIKTHMVCSVLNVPVFQTQSERWCILETYAPGQAQFGHREHRLCSIITGSNIDFVIIRRLPGGPSDSNCPCTSRVSESVSSRVTQARFLLLPSHPAPTRLLAVVSRLLLGCVLCVQCTTVPEILLPS